MPPSTPDQLVKTAMPSFARCRAASSSWAHRITHTAIPSLLSAGAPHAKRRTITASSRGRAHQTWMPRQAIHSTGHPADVCLSGRAAEARPRHVLNGETHARAKHGTVLCRARHRGEGSTASAERGTAKPLRQYEFDEDSGPLALSRAIPGPHAVEGDERAWQPPGERARPHGVDRASHIDVDALAQA